MELSEGAEGSHHRILDYILGEDIVAGQVAREVIGAIQVRQYLLPELMEMAGAG